MGNRVFYPFFLVFDRLKRHISSNICDHINYFKNNESDETRPFAFYYGTIEYYSF